MVPLSLPEVRRVWPLRALLCGAIAGPLAFFAVGAWQTHTQLYEQAEENVSHQVAVLDDHADKVFESFELVIEQVNQRTRDLSWDEIRTSQPLWDDLRQLVHEVQQLDAIFMIDPAGINAFTTRMFPPPAVDFSGRDYFIAQRDRDAGTYLGGPYIGAISSHPIFNMSRRRTGRQGSFDGVIGISASGYFERFYASISLPRDNAVVALTRDDGQLLARYPQESFPTEVGGKALVQKAGAAMEGLFYTAPEADGVRRLVGFRRLRDYPAFVSYSLDEGMVRAAWYRSLIPWATLAGLAAISLLLTTWLALRRARQEAQALTGWKNTYDDLLQETERRKFAENALAQTRKLEALGQLTGGVAHDFNNLLHVLGSHLGILDRVVTDERGRRSLAASWRTVERGEKLVQQLLAFARRQPLQFDVFDLNQRLGAIRDLAIRSLSGISLTIDAAPDLWPVEADANQLELAILNLVFNARDAMPNGGAIRIKTANRTFAKGEGELIGDFIAVSVSDNGTGMRPEVLERVWEPFFTTKPAGKGTGLGLSMVHGFIHQSGGDATIVSEVGKGTTVTLYLRKGTPTQAYEDPPAETSPVVNLRQSIR
jgi:signal transduction histidine kinase